MTTVILVLILIILVLLLCAASFVSGFVVANKVKTVTVSKLSEEDNKDLARKSREARIRQKELENFWSYNGDEQERIHYD